MEEATRRADPSLARPLNSGFAWVMDSHGSLTFHWSPHVPGTKQSGHGAHRAFYWASSEYGRIFSEREASLVATVAQTQNLNYKTKTCFYNTYWNYAMYDCLWSVAWWHCIHV